MRIIFEKDAYRIIEVPDEYADMGDLKGDTYNPSVNDDIPIDELKRQEKDFESLVNNEGVYGYALEKWNPDVGIGWEHVDSCFGFVGQYSESEDIFNHYIVGELKDQIP